MRVISGNARGRKLKEPTGNKIRPSSDKVKESIFNIIQFDIEGRSVLDLFAGTGQIGIEALSRGAKSAIFVDSSTDSTRLIRENLRICGFSDIAAVYTADAISYLEYDEKFDLIFIDPPYDSPLVSKAILKIALIDKLNINGIIMCEMRVADALPDIAPPYEIEKEYRYGGVMIVKIVRTRGMDVP